MAADLLEQSRRILEGVDDIERGNPFQPTNELCEVADGVAEVVVVRQRGGVHHRRRTGAWSTPAAPSPVRWCTAGSGRGAPSGSTPPSTPTATSTTSSARPSSTRSRRRTVAAAAVVGHEDVDPRFDRYVPDRRLQRRHQPAAVPHPGAAVADRVPPARHDLPRPPRPRRRRPGRRAAPRPRRDRRPHLGVGARARGRSAPATSSSGARRTPGTRRRCSATPEEWAVALREMAGARAPSCCCPATACRSPGRSRCAQALVDTADLLDSRSSTRRSR